jgi:hypothetical protein
MCTAESGSGRTAAAPSRPRRTASVVAAGLVISLAGGLALGGCQQATDTMKDTVQNAATTTGQAALAPAVNPVLDLLKQGDAQLNAGNLQAALTTLGGFSALWQKAAPVIQPLAGDKWPAIDTAAQMLIKTVGGSDPTPADTSSALTGLMGPLSALIGQ